MCTLIPESSSSHIQYTPGGLIYKPGGSNMQHVTSIAFLLLTYANYLSRTSQTVNCGSVSVGPTSLQLQAKKQVNKSHKPLSLSPPHFTLPPCIRYYFVQACTFRVFEEQRHSLSLNPKPYVWHLHTIHCLLIKWLNPPRNAMARISNQWSTILHLLNGKRFFPNQSRAFGWAHRVVVKALLRILGPNCESHYKAPSNSWAGPDWAQSWL